MLILSGFSLRGQSYPNHGLVLRDDIGETDNTDLDPNNGLHCISFSGCCNKSVPLSQRGEFVFPGGATQVPTMGSVGTTGYYRNRGNDQIFLNRLSTGTIQGIFECQIRTQSTQTMYDSFYIGVYDADSGKHLVLHSHYVQGVVIAIHVPSVLSPAICGFDPVSINLESGLSQPYTV